MIRIFVDMNNYLPQEVLFFIKLAPQIKEKKINSICGMPLAAIVHQIIHNRDYLDRVEQEDWVFMASVVMALREMDETDPALSERVLALYTMLKS